MESSAARTSRSRRSGGFSLDPSVSEPAGGAPLRVLHVGPVTSVHTQIAALAYETLGAEAAFLNTRKDVSVSGIPGVPFATDVVNPWSDEKPVVPGTGRGSSLAASAVQTARYLGLRDRRLDRALLDLRSTRRFDLVVGTWGLPVLEAMLAAQRVFNDAAMVYNVLTAPELPLEGAGWRIGLWKGYLKLAWLAERAAYRRMLRRCHVRVHCSSEMCRYMRREYDLEQHGIDVIRVELFNRIFFPVRRRAKLSDRDNRPHVVHLGATNFSGRGIDNLSGPFQRLAAAGINVHFASEADERTEGPEGPFCQRFPKVGGAVPGPELAEFATQFDAAIILFNVEREYARFRNALPTRFLFALTTGIPIVLPHGLFLSCQEYVERHDIGLAYRSERDLAQSLADPALMARLSANALRHSRGLPLEVNLEEYNAIFYDALYIRDVRAGKVPPGRPYRTISRCR